MKMTVRLGLAGWLALAALPGRAEEKIDTSNILVKPAIAERMTPEELRAYKERMARNLAERRKARAERRAAGGFLPNTPADTCPSATLEFGPLPFSTSGTTTGDADNYDLPADEAAPTCTASSACIGGGPAASLPRGAIWAGTGTGSDRAFHLKTDAPCDLRITMDPTDAGPADQDDLALIVYQSSCSNLLSDCNCVDDSDVEGRPEEVTLSAAAGTDYFVVVDGYSSTGQPPGDNGPFTLSISVASGSCNLIGSGILGVYHTVAPCRLVDTRGPTGDYGGPALVAGANRTVDVDGGSCGVPPTATAVFLNVTAVDPTGSGNLRLWPTGTALPNTSTLNFNAFQTRGNNGIVKLDGNRAFDIRSNQATHVIIDVAGYFEE